MPDLTPDQAIQALRGLPESRQRAILSKLSPEVKQGIMAKLGAGSPAAPPASAPKPEERTFGNYADEIARGVGRGVMGDVTGIAQTVMHPIDTATGLVKQAGTAASEAGKEFRDTEGAPLGQRLGAAALTGLENAPMIGGMVQHAEQGGEEMGSPEAAGAAAEGITAFAAPEVAGKALGVASKAIPGAAGKVVRGAAGTGLKTVRDLVRETKEDNAKAAAAADTKNASQAATRKGQVQKYFDKTQEAREANTAKDATASRKQALSQGVKRLDVQFQNDLKETAAKVKEQADQKYSVVREATKGQTVPSSQLSSAVKAAESKLQGSNESIKVFKDILSKHPDSEPEFVKYQGANIPKGHPLYDVLKEQGAAGGGSASFADLQGYYSELGDKLASGGLSGDVYQAMKSLHDSIGTMMQDVANRAGVGPKLADAQQFYRGYMQTFRDSSSPGYKAINAGERGKAIQAYGGKDQTGIEALARYNPDLARRANSIRGYAEESRSIRTPSGAEKAAPSLPPKAEPVVATAKKIGPEDVRAAKQKGIEARQRQVEHKAAWLAIGPAFYMVSDLLHGEMPSVGGTAMSVAAPLMVQSIITRVLSSPKAVEFLTKATPEDVAQIPPELRGNFPKILAQAQKRGIRVSPALTRAFTGAALAGTRKYDVQTGTDAGASPNH